MNQIVVLNIFWLAMMSSPLCSRVSFLKRKSHTSLTVHPFFNYVEIQFNKMIKQICSDNSDEYFSNEFKMYL
jgi:hypothetical protein